MNPDNTRFPGFKSDSRSSLSGPIEPGRDPTASSNSAAADSYEADRSGLILFLGILSLFMCGPVGLAAWIMAGSDLRKVRKGLLPPEKAGILKVGRALGIIGTVIFASVIISGAFMLQKQFGDLPGMLKDTPLAADQMMFAGEWLGKDGTVIRIQADGIADFKGKRSTITGGRVSIKGESMSIGILGFSKSWHIDTRPHLEDGNWIMQLDGERFVRKSEGQLVYILKTLTIVTQLTIHSTAPKPQEGLLRTHGRARLLSQSADLICLDPRSYTDSQKFCSHNRYGSELMQTGGTGCRGDWRVAQG